MTLKNRLLGLTLTALALTPAAAFACGGHYGLSKLKEKKVSPVEKTSVAPPRTKKPVTPKKIVATEGRPVDLVICLDTSGSMSGLIDSARKKIWDLCNLLAKAKPAPRLRVALLSYGGMENADGGYVVLRTNLTDDLDTVYEKLMKLQATGSTELVGRVLHESLTQLEWSKDKGALKMIFVAGNESADQDRTHDFRKLAWKAVREKVTVNAIYCGTDATSGVPATWRELAQRGGGNYAAIDHNKTITVPTPFDKKLVDLSSMLNKTYLPFGRMGRSGFAKQKVQDGNANGVGAGAARAEAKASGIYRNSRWDLVDACREKGFDWSKVKTEDLPEVLRKKTVAERKAYVAKLQAQRAVIQKQIQELASKRKAFIAKELKKLAAAGTKTLDDALAQAVRAQAKAKGFRFN